MNSIYAPLYNVFKEISCILRYRDVTQLGQNTDQVNESNEIKKNIDILANNKIISALAEIPDVIGYISEEEDKLTFLPGKEHQKKSTIAVFDPLDGSKNVYSNISVGTIYGLYTYDIEKDCLTDKVETGYCLYGPSTTLIKTENNERVAMYLLNACDMFDYIKEVKKSEENTVYSINMSYEYEKDIHYFINNLKQSGCTQRWCGALVADAHQVLMRGGTFIYPGSKNMPRGKIRYLYEALPIAYLFTVLDCIAVDININNLIDRIPYVKLANDSVHGETPIILSTYYSRKNLKSIFEINDIIKC